MRRTGNVNDPGICPQCGRAGEPHQVGKSARASLRMKRWWVKKKAGLLPIKGANETRRQVYDRYLLGAHWREKRAQRLEIDGHRCVRCGSDKKLHVHHKTYKSIGAELMEHLETLCQVCHRRHHKEERAARQVRRTSGTAAAIHNIMDTEFAARLAREP